MNLFATQPERLRAADPTAEGLYFVAKLAILKATSNGFTNFS